MSDLLARWPDWSHPSMGIMVVQWSLLLALASAAGSLTQRHAGLPKLVGYAAVGTVVGLIGFPGAAWPLSGIGLFLLELGIAVVLFDAGARISLRWFRHNPMVLVQSLVESLATFAAVFALLHALGVPAALARPLAVIAIAASPSVLTRVVMDMRASGPVTERSIVLSTLNTLYALAVGTAMARLAALPRDGSADGTVFAALSVLGVSLVVALLVTAVMRAALAVMNPTSENTSILLLALIAAGAALADHFGGSAALSALLAGLMLKQISPRPWSDTRQLGTAASLLVMLMFVLVSTVAAQAEWGVAIAGFALALVAARFVAKAFGLAIASVGSGMRLPQTFWVGCAMAPMSSVALLLASQFATTSPTIGAAAADIALPAILVTEVLGAVLAAYALYRAGEGGKPLSSNPPFLRDSGRIPLDDGRGDEVSE
ncbi:MAG: cation:proton antiporter [Burkholderiales bacterium]